MSIENITPPELELDVFVVIHRIEEAVHVNTFMSLEAAVECAMQIIREELEGSQVQVDDLVKRILQFMQDPQTYEAALYHYNRYSAAENTVLNVYKCPLQTNAHDTRPKNTSPFQTNAQPMKFRPRL